MARLVLMSVSMVLYYFICHCSCYLAGVALSLLDEPSANRREPAETMLWCYCGNEAGLVVVLETVAVEYQTGF